MSEIKQGGIPEPDSSVPCKPEVRKQATVITDFLKFQPTAIFTVIAGLVAVLTFFSNMAVFLYEQSYLNYWSIEAVYVDLSTPDRFYRICGALIFSFCIILVLLCLNGFLTTKTSSVSLIFINSLAASVMGMMLLWGMEIISADSALILSVFILAITVFATLVSVKRRKAGDPSKDNYVVDGDIYRDFLNDSNIVYYLSVTLFVGIAMLVGFWMMGHSAAQHQAEFPVVRLENQTYAIIYNTAESAILEECEVESGVITRIHKEKQRHVSIQNIEYEIMDYVPESETEPPQPSETGSTAEETT